MDENSVENWLNKARDWILTKCGSGDAAATLRQLRQFRKLRDVSVASLFFYMHKINSAIPYMSETLDSLPEEEMKCLFFEAFPMAWKNAFTEIHGVVDEDQNTVGKITSFMKLKAENAAKADHSNQMN